MSASNLSNVSSSEKDLDCGALYEPYVYKITLIVVYCMVLVGWLDWKRPYHHLGVQAERLKKDYKSAYREHRIF